MASSIPSRGAWTSRLLDTDDTFLNIGHTFMEDDTYTLGDKHERISSGEQPTVFLKDVKDLFDLGGDLLLCHLTSLSLSMRL